MCSDSICKNKYRYDYYEIKKIFQHSKNMYSIQNIIIIIIIIIIKRIYLVIMSKVGPNALKRFEI